MENQKLFKTIQLKRYLKKKNPGATGSFIQKNLCDPAFPLFFLLRNLSWLQRERWWNDLSSRARRVQAAKILRERIVFFNEVKVWGKKHSCGENGTQGTAPPQDVPSYCNKCGLCCEVASGMPDFPPTSKLPDRWRRMFGNGLGKGHRFCPFLWEDGSAGGSLCSVYPWRSNPCRVFESEECDFFWKHPEPEEISSEKKILLMRRWLANLINGRKLPLGRADIPAEGPELLEFHRI